MTSKINGYCAWHPENGWLNNGVCTKQHDAWIALMNDPVGHQTVEQKLFELFESHKRRLLDAGWIIRPVCLVDPAELERQKKIEEWAKQAYLRITFIIDSDILGDVLSFEELRAQFKEMTKEDLTLHYSSNCCYARAFISGDNEEGTHNYTCVRCLNACDLVIEEELESAAKKIVKEEVESAAKEISEGGRWILKKFKG